MSGTSPLNMKWHHKYQSEEKENDPNHNWWPVWEMIEDDRQECMTGMEWQEKKTISEYI